MIGVCLIRACACVGAWQRILCVLHLIVLCCGIIIARHFPWLCLLEKKCRVARQIKKLGRRVIRLTFSRRPGFLKSQANEQKVRLMCNVVQAKSRRTDFFYVGLAFSFAVQHGIFSRGNDYQICQSPASHTVFFAVPVILPRHAHHLSRSRTIHMRCV